MTFIKILEHSAAPIFTDRQGPRKLLTGMLLGLFPVLFFFPLGYVLSVLQAGMEEGEERAQLPAWKNMESLFIRGVVFFLVILLYSAIPFLFTSAAFRMLKMGFVFLPPAVVTLGLSAVLWLAAVYIMPMAMILFLRKKSIDAVFDLGEIYQRTSLALGNYLQATILNLGVLAAASLPAITTPAGYFISAPLIFLGMIFLAGVYGNVCREIFPQPRGS